MHHITAEGGNPVNNMLGTLEMTRFISIIRTWGQLRKEEQDEVISRSFERYATRIQKQAIPNPVGWLILAAKFVAKEVVREERARRNAQAGYFSPIQPDKRLNGFPILRCIQHLEMQEEGDSRPGPDLLSDLSPTDRLLAELCGIEGLTPAEAGRILGMCRATTKSRWQRLIAKLSLRLDLRKHLKLRNSEDESACIT